MIVWSFPFTNTPKSFLYHIPIPYIIILKFYSTTPKKTVAFVILLVVHSFMAKARYTERVIFRTTSEQKCFLQQHIDAADYIRLAIEEKRHREEAVSSSYFSTSINYGERCMNNTTSTPDIELLQKGFRQGDVRIRLVKLDIDLQTCKEVAREGGRVVLAHGEVTGHAHAITDPSTKLFDIGQTDNVRLMIAPNGAIVEHEEHDAIDLPVIPDGYAWEVKRQREYSEEAIRQVMD